MIDLYDPETDGMTGDTSPTATKEMCDSCNGSGKVLYGIHGFVFEYPCPRCKK